MTPPAPSLRAPTTLSLSLSTSARAVRPASKAASCGLRSFSPRAVRPPSGPPSSCPRRSFSYFSPALSEAKQFPPLIGRHRAFPDDLFGINASAKVILRDYKAQMAKGRTSYDLHVHDDGLVHPRPGPNFEGIELPPELVLLHEHSDHFSVQCTRPMTLAELNKRVTAFMQEHGEAMTKNEFCERYPFQP